MGGEASGTSTIHFSPDATNILMLTLSPLQIDSVKQSSPASPTTITFLSPALISFALYPLFTLIF
jgi:hypothetical protein